MEVFIKKTVEFKFSKNFIISQLFVHEINFSEKVKVGNPALPAILLATINHLQLCRFWDSEVPLYIVLQSV